MSLRVAAIAAMDEGRVIGNNNQLPWHIPQDMKRFMELTKGSAVLMGRKTFESLPPKFRPLPQRHNIVITHSSGAELRELGVEVWQDPLECIRSYRSKRKDTVKQYFWIIGGEQIYRATLPEWDEVYLTLVPGRHPGDAYFPPFEDQFTLQQEEKTESCTFQLYQRPARDGPGPESVATTRPL